MIEPKVSVVIATYNRKALLRQAVQSIFEQTFQNFEIILVDDCSQDETPYVIQSLVELDPRVRSFRTPQNSGPGYARNFGIAQAKADLVAILDDDDRAIKHRLQFQVALLDTNPGVDLVFSSVQWVDEDQQFLDIFPGRAANGTFPNDPMEVFRFLYLESNKIPNTTLCFRKSLATGKTVGGRLLQFAYPPEPRVGEDWLFVMQLSASGVRMLYSSEPLVLVQRGQLHENLMNQTRYAYQSQRQVLRMIQKWLASENIPEFDNLHSRAMSNQLVREARGWSGLYGIWICLQAIRYSPANPLIYKTLAHLFGKGARKLKFSISMAS